MSSQSLALSLFVHITATAIWIGGLLITMLLVWPAVQRTVKKEPTLYRLLSQLRKRFYPISNLALVALIATGLFQMTASSQYDGFLNFDNTWSKVMLVKHIVIGLMAIAGLILQYAVTPELERTSLLLELGKGSEGTDSKWQVLRRRETILTWVNGLLGLSVLAFSAWLSALSKL
ncbi:MAG: CopD family protein [Anaerolineae bacterium]|nr:CopD family protein [Anaerolineae bacterium]